MDLLALNAFWELLSEGYVVWRMRRKYPLFEASLAVLLFWPLMAALALLPWRRAARPPDLIGLKLK